MKLFKASIIFFGLLFFIGLAVTIFQTDERKFHESCHTAQESFLQFENAIDALSKQEDLVNQISRNSLSTEALTLLAGEDFYFYLYAGDSLLFWNNNKTIPEMDYRNVSFKGELIVNKNGFYIGTRREIGEYQLVGLQLVKRNFPIVNRYLTNKFSSSYPFDDAIQIVAGEADGNCTLYNSSNQGIATFTDPGAETHKVALGSLAAGIMSVIAFWLVVWQLISYFNSNYPIWVSYIILLISSVIFFELIEFVNFEFKASILFSPELYASQYFGPSLGHLFFNAVIVLFVNLLIGYQYYLKQWRLKLKGFLVFSFWLLIQLTLYNAIVQSLILDSIISFEINTFTLTTPYTFLGLSIISILSASLFICLSVCLDSNKQNFPKYKFISSFCLMALATIVLYLFQFELVAIVVPSILWIHSIIFYVILKHSKYANRFSYLTNALFFAALIIASILSYYNIRNEDFRKEIAANHFSKNRDLITEYRFEEIQEEIKKDPFFRKFFVSPFVSQKELQQRLNYLYFGGYLSKYNVSSTAFNLEGKPIKIAGNTQLEFYYDLINQHAEDTYSEWLFLVPQKDGKSNYLSILPIENNGKVSGTLVLELSPKTYTKENLYPELLIEQKTSAISQLQNSKDYEYAIYKSNFLVNQSGEYPFPYDFLSFGIEEQIPDVQNDGKFRFNFFKIDDETTVVISDTRSSFLIPVSTFSYVFCFLSLVVAVSFLVFYFINKHIKVIPLKPIRFTFQNKINLSIALITIASFVIIGLVTIGYFSESYRANNTDKLIKKQQIVLSSLEYFIAGENQDIQESLPSNLATELASMAEIHGIDINLFSLNGALLLSSQPGVFGNGLVSKKINPLALHHMLHLREERYIQEETIGSLRYQSVYVPVRLNSGQAIAILNLPYFAQEETLRNELSNLMVALVNVYVLLLMISIFVAFIISSSITRPLANISQKIGSLSFDNHNEAIEWDSDDEIGALVKEYNKMILQIEESANAMAQSERESAWREMARQIAHEIKNPLTPMKLGIQHLQRAIQQDPDRVNELAERVCKTMVEQIENLSEIATAFSSFAKMPTANKEKVNLIEILQNVINLFNQNRKTPIEFSSKLTQTIVYADKNQLLRVFNNLIKNAQQATEDLESPEVKIEVHSIDHYFLVQVIDNGLGIPEDKIHKVFVPNFTTKSSGTGLGLAISKQIIENTKGKIWFESKENNGTTFFVTLPKYTKPA
ncbi:MAG: two-component system nitrogen regulation sensor histidine kinase NtrY [Chitinophagales bacterium]